MQRQPIWLGQVRVVYRIRDEHRNQSQALRQLTGLGHVAGEFDRCILLGMEAYLG
jgi:hypothetical protein